MLTAIDHVQLAAPPGSEDLLRAYYVDVLGMTEIPKPPVLAARGGCWFQAGAVQLHLGIEDAPAGGGKCHCRPAKKAHPGLRVTGIEAYAARLAARGGAGDLGRQSAGAPPVLLGGSGGEPAGVPGAAQWVRLRCVTRMRITSSSIRYRTRYLPTRRRRAFGP